MARRLLLALLPPEDRATFPGELDELREKVSRARGPRAARWWYRRQVATLAVGRAWAAARRWTRGFRQGWREVTSMEGLRRDVGYALRRLLRTPGFTLVALASLALGIGANTAIFSLFDAVVLRDTALERPEELVELYTRSPGWSHGSLSWMDLEDIEERTSDVFQGISASRLALLSSSAADGTVEMLPAEMVSGDYFTLQGIDAALGRTVLPEDDREESASPVVVLDHRFWQRRFAGDPGVVGREVRIGGQPLTVIGVAEEAWEGTVRGLVPDVYVPVHMAPLVDPSNDDFGSRGNQSFFARGRLVDGATPARAAAALDRVTAWLRETAPDDWKADESLVLVPTPDVVVNPMIDRVLVPALGLLLAVVGIVLVIACANLASFLLAQGADRRREVAVRLAMGARRAVLVRQLLTETVVLGLLGGAAGLALAAWLMRLAATLELPLPVPITLGMELNGTVLAFALGVSILAGLFFGLTPALHASRAEVAATLKNEATGERPRALSARNVLVVGQVALSMVLLVGAGLLARSMVARQSVDPGFGHEPAAVVQLGTGADADEAEGLRRIEEIERRVEALPGVEAVGVATNLHLNTLSTSSRYVEVDGIAPPPGRDVWQIDWAAVTPGFMDAAGLRLLRGRAFQASDDGDAAPVLVVNQAFAEQFFPGGDAVGGTVRLGEREHTVVGVVNTARIRSLGEAPRPFVYSAFAQRPDGFGFMVARTRGVDPRATALEMGRIGREVDPDLRIYDRTTMEAHLSVVLFPARASALAAGVFALLALALASIGLYGVVSYAVSSRTREVGIRMSLGARSTAVVRLLMGQGLRLVGVGAGLGLLGAAGAALVLSRFLYGVSAFDPLAFLGTGAVLVVVATLAAWVPARRVTRIDPVRALRSE